MPHVWSKQKHFMSPRRRMGFSTTIVALGAITLPCWQLLGSGLTIREPSVWLQESQKGLWEPVAYHLTAQYNVPLRIHKSAIKADLTSSHSLSFSTAVRLLQNIGIELIGNSNQGLEVSPLSCRRPSAVANPYETRAEVPLLRGAEVAPETSGRQSAARLCHTQPQPQLVPSTANVNQSVPLYTPQMVVTTRDGGRAIVQLALARLKDDLQKETSESFTKRPLFTNHELDSLVACCHVGCLVPEILRNAKSINRSGTSNSLVREISTVRRALDRFLQAEFFPNPEFAMASDTERIQAQPGITQSYAKIVDVRKCLRLAAQYVKECNDNLEALRTAVNERKGDTRRGVNGLTIRKALRSVLPRYRDMLASIASKTNLFQLCALLQAVPHRETLPEQPFQSTLRSPESLHTVYGGYSFCSTNTTYDIVECAVALQRGEKILQLLRHRIKNHEAADCAENHLLEISRRTFITMGRLLNRIQGSSEKDLFKNGVERNSYVQQRLGTADPDYPSLEYMSGAQLLLRFRTIHKIVDLRLQKLVDDAVSCNMLAQRIKSADCVVQRAQRRIQRYARELVLAYGFLQQKLYELILNSRKPLHPQPPVLTSCTVQPSQRIQLISTEPSSKYPKQRIDLCPHYQTAGSSDINRFRIPQSSSGNILKVIHSRPSFAFVDPTAISSVGLTLDSSRDSNSANYQRFDLKGANVLPIDYSHQSKQQDTSRFFTSHQIPSQPQASNTVDNTYQEVSGAVVRGAESRSSQYPVPDANEYSADVPLDLRLEVKRLRCSPEQCSRPK